MVDASLAVKWVLEEPHSPRARDLLEWWVHSRVVISAPTLLVVETANVLFKRVRRSELTVEGAKDGLAVLASMVTLVPRDDAWLAIEALSLAHAHNLPATYDAISLALAMRLNCRFWTADERLWNQIRQRVPWVIASAQRKTNCLRAWTCQSQNRFQGPQPAVRGRDGHIYSVHRTPSRSTAWRKAGLARLRSTTSTS